MPSIIKPGLVLGVPARDLTTVVSTNPHARRAYVSFSSFKTMGKKRAKRGGPEAGPRYNLRSVPSKTVENARTTDELPLGRSVRQATYNQSLSCSGILLDVHMSEPKAAEAKMGRLPPGVRDGEPVTFVGQALLDILEHPCTLKQEGVAEAQSTNGAQASAKKIARHHRAKRAKPTLLPSPSEGQRHVASFEPPKALQNVSASSFEHSQTLPIRQISTAHMHLQPPERGSTRREVPTHYLTPQSMFQSQAYPTRSHLTPQYNGLGQGLWPLPANLLANAAPFISSAFMPSSFQYPQHNPLFTPYTPMFHYPTPSLTPIHSYHNTTVRNPAARDNHQLSARQPALPSSPRLKLPSGEQMLVPSDRPNPSDTYLSKATLTPKPLISPQTLLIISDLNGTLIYRKPRTSNFQPRPGLIDFLTNLFENHKLMVWTSSRTHNMVEICSKLFKSTDQSRLVATWARDKLGLTFDQYNGKTQVYKRLTSVWNDREIQATHPDYKNGGRWSQANTLLVDDSTEKAAAEPYNLINVPELTRDLIDVDAQKNVLGQVAEYIEEARHWNDVSAFARQRPFRVREHSNREEVPSSCARTRSQRRIPQL